MLLAGNSIMGINYELHFISHDSEPELRQTIGDPRSKEGGGVREGTGMLCAGRCDVIRFLKLILI